MSHRVCGPIHTCNYEEPLVTCRSLLSVIHPFCTWPGLMLRHLSSLHAAEGPLALIKIQFPVEHKKTQNRRNCCVLSKRKGFYLRCILRYFHQVFLVAPIFDNKIIFIIHIQPNKEPLMRLFGLFKTSESLNCHQRKGSSHYCLWSRMLT